MAILVLRLEVYNIKGFRSILPTMMQLILIEIKPLVQVTKLKKRSSLPNNEIEIVK